MVEHKTLVIRLDAQRNVNKPQGGTWGVPAGKVEPNEDLRAAMARELWEETQIEVMEKKLSFFNTVYISFPAYDFTYHMFSVGFKSTPVVSLDTKSHDTYQWVRVEESLQLSLMTDLDACVKLFFHSKN